MISLPAGGLVKLCSCSLSFREKRFGSCMGCSVFSMLFTYFVYQKILTLLFPSQGTEVASYANVAASTWKSVCLRMCILTDCCI